MTEATSGVSDATDTTRVSRNLGDAMHTGRVYVRGRIVRAWRPRCLEIFSDGLLRYYEAAADTSVNTDDTWSKLRAKGLGERGEDLLVDNDWEDLTGFSAATSACADCDSVSGDVEESDQNLGDQNVQQLSCEDTSAAVDKEGKLPCSSGSETIELDENCENHTHRRVEQHDGRRKLGHRPKSTLLVLHARAIDPVALRDMHVGLPAGKYGFLFRARETNPFSDGNLFANDFDDEQENLEYTSSGTSVLDHSNASAYPYGNSERNDETFTKLLQLNTRGKLSGGLSTCKPFKTTDLPQARDYLCAVSTENEADAWVVALRWAAEMARSKSAHILARGFGEEDPRILQRRPNDVEGIRENFNKMMQKSVLAGKTTSSAKENVANASFAHNTRDQPKQQEQVPSISKGGTATAKGTNVIILTKIHNIMWRAQNWPSYLFKVQTLLLDCHRNGDGIREAEEVTVYRSRNDIKNIISGLKVYAQTEMNRNNAGTNLINVLEKAEEKAFLLLRGNAMQAWLYSDQMIAQANEILRTISRSTICNSPLLKDFLGCGSIALRPEEKNDVVKKRIVLSGSHDECVRDWLRRGSFVMDERPFFISFRSINIFLFSFLALLGYYRIAGRVVVVKIETILATVLCSFAFGVLFGHKKISASSAVDTSSRPNKEEEAIIAEKTPASVADNDEIGITADGSRRVGYDSAIPSEGMSVTTGTEGDFQPLVWKVKYNQQGSNCWSVPDHNLFSVRTITYLQNRVKAPTAKPPFECRGVEIIFNEENPVRHIASHPRLLKGNIDESCDTFIINFLLPFGNLVAYFSVPNELSANVEAVWNIFKNGDQEQRDARLKMLPVVVEGPWIVQKAVGPGNAPALLGKVMPLQYYFRNRSPDEKEKGTGIYEVDILVGSSKLAKTIFNVVRPRAKILKLALAFILEGKELEELPESVLCAFTINNLDLEQGFNTDH